MYALVLHLRDLHEFVSACMLWFLCNCTQLHSLLRNINGLSRGCFWDQV